MPFTMVTPSENLNSLSTASCLFVSFSFLKTYVIANHKKPHNHWVNLTFLSWYFCHKSPLYSTHYAFICIDLSLPCPLLWMFDPMFLNLSTFTREEILVLMQLLSLIACMLFQLYLLQYMHAWCHLKEVWAKDFCEQTIVTKQFLWYCSSTAALFHSSTYNLFEWISWVWLPMEEHFSEQL